MKSAVRRRFLRLLRRPLARRVLLHPRVVRAYVRHEARALLRHRVLKCAPARSIARRLDAATLAIAAWPRAVAGRYFAITAPAARPHALKRPWVAAAAAVLIVLFAASALAQDDESEDVHQLVVTELIASQGSAGPGEEFRVGVRFKLVDRWHVYWTNPGDAGIPTTVEWGAPEGFTVSETQYPAPIRFGGTGEELSGYGYEKEVLLFADVRAPDDLAPGDVTFTAKAAWLVCREKCIPGDKELSLTLPVHPAETAGVHASLFDRYAALVPVSDADATQVNVAATLSASAVRPEEEFTALFVVRAAGDSKIAARRDAHMPLLIPSAPQNYEVDSVTTLEAGPAEELAVKLTGRTFPGDAASEKVGGVFQLSLVRGEESTPLAVSFETALPRVPAGAAVTKNALSSTDISRGSAGPDPMKGALGTPAAAPPFLLMLVFGFFGGVILNFMPCVLPVVSIKIMTLMRHAELTPRQIRVHGVAYTVGIVASFALLAGLVGVLKAGGEAVGWGFQFQSPLFVSLLAAVVFVFALSLFGVFEIQAPSSGLFAEASSREGIAGSLASGAFATLLATPCTAPFLGTALGFAFSQPLITTLLVFMTIGLGLAFPFLALAFVPAWARSLPKPGDWMDTFRAIMGFLLVATVIWLLDVLGQQVGAAGLTRMLIFLGVLAVAAFIAGRFGSIMRAARVRAVAYTVALIIALAGAAMTLRFTPAPASAAGVDQSGGHAWEAFSEDRVRELADSGRTVFIDFTAAWCWTCKVNEGAVINTDEIREAFKTYNVAAVKGDWTSRDPAITAYLKRHGKAGVPLYVVIAPGRADAPVLLPEIVTRDMVVEAVKRAAESAS
ncbi:thioredoxin family protein [bacterium]|nr:thioredoxin family protein [bacterium]